MRGIDQRAIEGYGIPGMVLMERAGLAVARTIRELYSERKVIVLSGTGNNGGDGVVAARELWNSGRKVRVLVTGGKEALSPDMKAQCGIAGNMGIPVEFSARLSDRDLHGALLVDAVFGTGLSKPVSGAIAGTFRLINESPAPVLSVDIPSGVSADTGEVLGEAVTADTTVTFGAPKRGHLLHPGAARTGRLLVEDIGFPGELFRDIKCTLLEKAQVAQLVPPRPRYSHKGHYGHVLLVAGSRGKTGAALMAARACLRAGAGLLTLGVPGSLAGAFQGRVTEEMTLPLPDTSGGGFSSKALDEILGFLDERGDVLALGPGLGRDSDTARLVRGLVASSAAPMLIDADGLNALAGHPDIFRKARAPVVLTPHAGEFSRLTGLGRHEIEADRIETALAFANKAGVYLILKGAPTVIAEPGGEAFVNSTGNPGLAKAGTGDILTGMVAAFIAQGMSPLEAALLGVYMHGLAGDLAASVKTEYSVLASDVAEAVPLAFMRLREAC
jgi:NAD(P)H-hydrate epimerase